MLTFEIRGPVTVAHLDDGKANAVGHAFLDAANEALDAASEGSALVLIGREGVFSAGFDLKELQKGSAEREALVGRGAHFLHRLFTDPQPVVAAATGHAIKTRLAELPAGAYAANKMGVRQSFADAIAASLPPAE